MSDRSSPDAPADRDDGRNLSVHLSSYQARDHDVVDYKMHVLGGTGLAFRGPSPENLDPNGYFACIGAAQTFGCFCEHAFPDILAREIGLPALNLGYGGAGPEFFAGQEKLLPYLNRARFVVLQVMSARSQSNSYYHCGGLELVTLKQDGRQTGAQAAFSELVRGPAWLADLPGPPRVIRKIANLAGRPRTHALVREIRAAWIESNLRVLEQIEVPVVLFWFSKRPPAYTASFATVGQLFGEFPHLVTPDMLDPLKVRAAAYAECISDRGSPQTLYNRFTGEPTMVDPANDRPDLAVPPWRENFYYPSPEMHEDGARALAPLCRAFN